MRRTYDRQRYMDRVSLIREHVPDCAITTDVIVGFPGETEADFEQTLEVVDEVGYDSAFTFVFSPRRETEAASWTTRCRTRSRPSGWSGWSSWCSGGRRNVRSASSGARWRCWSKGPAGRTRRGCGDGTRHNKAVNFEGTAQPGEFVMVEVVSATSQTLMGTEKLLSRVG